jgi:hypothetical protein
MDLGWSESFEQTGSSFLLEVRKIVNLQFRFLHGDKSLLTLTSHPGFSLQNHFRGGFFFHKPLG